MIESSEAKAKSLNLAVSTIVVDEHGVIISMSRMDGALYISPKIAYAKAYTAALLKVPTDGLANYVGEGKPYQDVTSLFSGELTCIAGGIPVLENGIVVGAVGVGGSMDVSQDAQCAQVATTIQ